MRNSGHDVDDAGDASNSDIGLLPTCLLEPVSLSHHVRDPAESGLARRSGNLGKGLSRRSQTGDRLEQIATAMPNQTSVGTKRDRCPVPPGRRITPNERDLARPRRVEKRHFLQASFA